MSTNSSTSQSVSHGVERILQEAVTDRSVPGARMQYVLPVTGSMGLSIPRQYAEGPWEWVILNGGGNDLLLGCGCGACDRKMASLISYDARTGSIPSLISRLRQGGAKVVYVGYLRSPGINSMIERCRNEGDTLEGRIADFAARDRGVFFVSLKDLVPPGDESYFGPDNIHPAPKTSLEIGRRVAEVIRRN